MILRLLRASCLAIVACTGGLAHSEDVILGVLEEVPGVYVGEEVKTKVRALFARKGLKWEAYKSDCGDSECLSGLTSEYPGVVSWSIGLSGIKIGQVVARTPEKFAFYAHIGLQEIVSGKVPVVGKRSSEFGGFSGHELHRPLVADSKPYFRDPARWRPVQVTPDIQRRTLRLFREQVPNLCKLDSSDDQSLIPFPYGAKDLRVHAHRSNQGLLVMTVAVSDAYYCKGGRGDGSFDSQTFAIDASGKGKFLGTGITFLDAGDYDSDGQSELLFLLSLYNRGGYVLFSSHFTELARFEFGYH